MAIILTCSYIEDFVVKTSTSKTEVGVVEVEHVSVPERPLPRLRDLTTLTADRSVDDIFEITDGRDDIEDDTIGPYNAAALAGRALDLGAGISQDYLDGFVDGLKDLHNLYRLPEPNKPRKR